MEVKRKRRPIGRGRGTASRRHRAKRCTFIGCPRRGWCWRGKAVGRKDNGAGGGVARGSALARALRLWTAGMARGLKRQGVPFATAGATFGGGMHHRSSQPPWVRTESANAGDNGSVRGFSSAGRALQSHCRGQGFESPTLHFASGFTVPDGRGGCLGHRARNRPDGAVQRLETRQSWLPLTEVHKQPIAPRNPSGAWWMAAGDLLFSPERSSPSTEALTGHEPKRRVDQEETAAGRRPDPVHGCRWLSNSLRASVSRERPTKSGVAGLPGARAGRSIRGSRSARSSPAAGRRPSGPGLNVGVQAGASARTVAPQAWEPSSWSP